MSHEMLIQSGKPMYMQKEQVEGGVVMENGLAKVAEKSKPTESINLGAISNEQTEKKVKPNPSISKISSISENTKVASKTTITKTALVKVKGLEAINEPTKRPTPCTTKTGATGGKTISAGTGRAASTVLRAQSSTTATKPSAAAERVAAARAAAKALKPNAGKVKLAGESELFVEHCITDFI